MATIRRLEDKDVRSIFECLHEGKPPPFRLSFQIVPVGSNGLKLSPPSYEFPDGLYVLLRPRVKSKTVDHSGPRAPPHLQHLVWKEGEIPPESCPWSLSGPQFPQPTAIQQRYCYPKGRSEYSDNKGGALWTMYNTNGKEDTEFRLLHVYYSAKRAVNKGFKPDKLLSATFASPLKRVKRESLWSPLDNGSPPPTLSSPSSRLLSSPGSFATKSNRSSLSYRSSLTSEEPSCPSPPLCLEAFFPPSPGTVHRKPSLDNSNFVSPVNDNFYRRNPFHPATLEQGHHPMILPGPYTFHQPSDVALAARNRLPLPQFHVSRRPSPKVTDNSEDFSHHRQCGLDPFPCDMSSSLHDMDSVAWNNDHINDSLLAMDAKPVNVKPTQRNDTDDNVAQNLMSRLGVFHEHARDSILSAPQPEQASLTNVYANWALHISRDPLGGIDAQAECTDKDISDVFGMGQSAIV
ncbi:hypothetical protein MPSEU_000276400 [Mayamaea pseudoterrestris]|nr:hypothetical protein MPSEU_000276400 [Mayamaea pseudoterrestris]